MGTWGTSVFANDLSCDVKNEYTILASYFDNDEYILDLLKMYFNINDLPCEDEADFWYSLAFLQTKYGRLCDEVKDNALYCIDRRFTTDGWFNKNDIIQRSRVLIDLKNKILCCDNIRKKIAKPKREKALWKENDVVAYHLVNIVDNQYKKISDYWYYAKYILLKVVKSIESLYLTL